MQALATGTCVLNRRAFLPGNLSAGTAFWYPGGCEAVVSGCHYWDCGRKRWIFSANGVLFRRQFSLCWCYDRPVVFCRAASPDYPKRSGLLPYSGDDIGCVHRNRLRRRTALRFSAGENRVQRTGIFRKAGIPGEGSGAKCLAGHWKPAKKYGWTAGGCLRSPGAGKNSAGRNAGHPRTSCRRDMERKTSADSLRNRWGRKSFGRIFPGLFCAGRRKGGSLFSGCFPSSIAGRISGHRRSRMFSGKSTKKGRMV